MLSLIVILFLGLFSNFIQCQQEYYSLTYKLYLVNNSTFIAVDIEEFSNATKYWGLLNKIEFPNLTISNNTINISSWTVNTTNATTINNSSIENSTQSIIASN